MNAARQLWAHLRKEVLLEWRSRDAINGLLFFSLLVIVVMSLAFDPTLAQSRAIAGGILWIALLFAIVVAVNQAWLREQRHAVLDGLRMSPADPALLFLGKALANFLFVTAVELIATPVFVVFYNLHPLGETWKLLLILPLGTWALVVNGTFFAALGLRTRNRETLLPLVLLPVSMPALLAMIQATTNVLTGEREPTLWIKVLVTYVIVFTIACIFLFETILNAD